MEENVGLALRSERKDFASPVLVRKENGTFWNSISHGKRRVSPINIQALFASALLNIHDSNYLPGGTWVLLEASRRWIARAITRIRIDKRGNRAIRRRLFANRLNANKRSRHWRLSVKVQFVVGWIFPRWPSLQFPIVVWTSQLSKSLTGDSFDIPAIMARFREAFLSYRQVYRSLRCTFVLQFAEASGWSVNWKW